MRLVSVRSYIICKGKKLGSKVSNKLFSLIVINIQIDTFDDTLYWRLNINIFRKVHCGTMTRGRFNKFWLPKLHTTYMCSLYNKVLSLFFWSSSPFRSLMFRRYMCVNFAYWNANLILRPSVYALLCYFWQIFPCI